MNKGIKIRNKEYGILLTVPFGPNVIDPTGSIDYWTCGHDGKPVFFVCTKLQKIFKKLFLWSVKRTIKENFFSRRPYESLYYRRNET